MTEPRTRTAAEVADHASAVQADAFALVDRATVRDDVSAYEFGRTATGLIERLAAQVEDLAAVVAQYEWSDSADDIEVDPATIALFPPVAWPITLHCSVSEDVLAVSSWADDGIHVQAIRKGTGTGTTSEVCSALLSGSDARLLAQAILDRLDGAS